MTHLLLYELKKIGGKKFDRTKVRLFRQFELMSTRTYVLDPFGHELVIEIVPLLLVYLKRKIELRFVSISEGNLPNYSITESLKKIIIEQCRLFHWGNKSAPLQQKL